ncbi:MAG TPA: hypothetical protein VMH91_02950 [Candidatus Paceibacterota bacterium]|nr:hypothetical protein [Candidatus Paceibacterota bacterium]
MSGKRYGILLLSAFLSLVSLRERVFAQTALEEVSLVELYRTSGIQECGYDYRHKGKYTGAVLLRGEDFARAVAFLQPRFPEGVITAVLYINSPENTSIEGGQPALLPLERGPREYCALGVAGSYSNELFLDFRDKYQSKLK